MTAPDPALAGDPQYLEVMGHLPAEYSSVAYVNIGLVVDPLLTLFTMMEGSESGMAEATPVGPQAVPQNVRALAMVGYRDGDAFGSSAILYIAEAGS